MAGDPNLSTAGKSLDWFSAVAMGQRGATTHSPNRLPLRVFDLAVENGLEGAQSLASRLKAWREYREIPTQGSLEKASGLAHGTVMRIENGQATNPCLSTLLKLAKVLGITVSELVGK